MTETTSQSAPVDCLVIRLRGACGGRDVWRVEKPDGSYCIEFSHSDSNNPKCEADAWLRMHQETYPESYSDQTVQHHKVQSHNERLMSEAAEAIERRDKFLATVKQYAWDNDMESWESTIDMLISG